MKELIYTVLFTIFSLTAIAAIIPDGKAEKLFAVGNEVI